MSESEKAQVRDLLNSERFQDQPPREVYATLLDEGQYHCSWRTMYRILAQHAEVRARRNQLRHPIYQRPELLATGPKQLWSWDITKLRGPAKGLCYYLYVILDVFSRYVPGWLIAERESAELAEELIAATCRKQGIAAGQLTIHADHGSPMIAKPVTQLMADLGVAKSHSRPHLSNDNPYSEAQFRTLKYSPTYPERFGSLADARQWSQGFFSWYNDEHHHTGLALLTPTDVHYSQAAAILAERQAVLQRAYAAHPERFVNGPPTVTPLPAAVWINPPKPAPQQPSTPEPRSPAGVEHIAAAMSESCCQSPLGACRQVAVHCQHRAGGSGNAAERPAHGGLHRPSAVPGDGVAGPGRTIAGSAHTDPENPSYTVRKAINRCRRCRELRLRRHLTTAH